MCQERHMEQVSEKLTVRTEHAEEKKLFDAQALVGMEDTLVSQSRLIDSMKTNADMSTWIRDYKIPDRKTLKESYNDSRGAAFYKADVIDSHKSKRKSAYMEKAKTQTVASGVTHRELESREKAKNAFLEETPEIEVAEEDVAFLQDWSALLYSETQDHDRFSVLADIFSEEVSKQKQAAGEMAERILSLDMSDFDYKDDQEFLRKISEKDVYKKLCAMSDAWKIVGILDNGLPDARITKLKSRIMTLQDIREDYENRLTILQSPYYALLLSSDKEDVKYKRLREAMADDPASMAYFTAVEKRPVLKFGKGKSAKELEKGYLAEDKEYKRIEKHESLAEDLRAFAVTCDQESILTSVNELVSLLKGQIPSDPEEQKTGAQAIREKYVSAGKALKEYVDRTGFVQKMTGEQEPGYQEVKPLLERLLDEQQVFLEAEERITRGEFTNTTGTWTNVLLSVDDESAFVAPTVEDSLMRQEHFNLEAAERELLESEVKYGLITHKDSPAMLAVKEAITSLNSVISRKITDLKMFDAEKEAVETAYQTVIDRCLKYQDNIRTGFLKGHSAIGKRRMELVSQIIEKSFYEKTMLENMTSRELGVDSLPAGATWAQVMYNARAMRVKADDPNVSIVGAGTSFIYRVSSEDGSTSYVKMAEKISTRRGDIASMLTGFRVGNDEKRVRMADGIGELLKTEQKSTESALSLLIDGYGQMLNRKYEWEEGVSEEDYKKTVKRNVREALLGRISLDIRTYVQPLQDLISSDIETFADFVEFYYKKENEYKVASDSAGIAPGSYISDRNVSTSRLAEKLGISDLVAGSRSILMISGTELSRANEMEGVETKSLQDLKEYCEHYHLTLKYSPEVVKQLTTLQIFDQICGQIDRHEGNYNVFFDDSVPGEITVTSLKGVDNDLSFGTLMRNDVAELRDKLRGMVVDKKNTVPYIDRKFYETLVALDMPTIEMIAADQADLRSDEEIAALKDRLIGVRSHLMQMVQGGFTALVEKDEDWSQAVEGMKQMDRNGQLGDGYVKHHGLLD